MYLLYVRFNAVQELQYIEVFHNRLYNFQLILKFHVAISMIRLDLIFDKNEKNQGTHHITKMLEGVLLWNLNTLQLYKIFPINLKFLHLPEYNTQYTIFCILEISPLQREILTKIQTNIAFTWIQNNIGNDNNFKVLPK